MTGDEYEAIIGALNERCQEHTRWAAKHERNGTPRTGLLYTHRATGVADAIAIISTRFRPATAEPNSEAGIGGGASHNFQTSHQEGDSTMFGFSR